MKLCSIYNQLDRLELQRADRERIQRLREQLAELEGMTMDLTSCPRCGDFRPSNERPCSRCSRAAVATIVSGRSAEVARRHLRLATPPPSAFMQAMVEADAISEERLLELRAQARAARAQGERARLRLEQAGCELATGLREARRAHGIDGTGALLGALLVVGIVLGAAWLAMPEREQARAESVEQPATVAPTWTAR